MKVCTRCILNENIPRIEFNVSGECNYCKKYDEMDKMYLISDETLNKYIEKIKDNNHPKYDAVVGLSGGTDSSYLLWKMHEKKVRMLGVHFDNGWNTQIADDNIQKAVKHFNIDFIRIGTDQNELNKINKSFLYASTPDADIPNDMALITCLYQVCDTYNIKYILDGHSFRTEGFMPLGWSYMDSRYVTSVHQEFSKEPIKYLPALEVHKWIRWLKKGITRFRGLYHIDYIKELAKQELHKEFGWNWYGGHHAENIYTKFVANYLRPQKFKVDPRLIEYSALIRSGQMNRNDALIIVAQEPQLEKRYLWEVLVRLDLGVDEFKTIMKQPIKSYQDYKTYQPYFKANKQVFKELYEQGTLPKTFYMKYVED